MIIKNIVFWGNINIHIYPLAIALTRKLNVFIIINNKTISTYYERNPIYEEESRLKIINIEDNSIKKIIHNFDIKETIHINSALKHTNDFTHKALLLLLHKRAKIISLPQEGFQFYGIKKSINKFKWKLYINYIYNRITAYGLTGENAVNDFKYIKCNMNKCFPFMYITKPFITNDAFTENNIFKIIYVGAIDNRKNIINTIDLLIKNNIDKEYKFELHIYGGYGNIDELKKIIEGHNSFIYHGIVPNNIVRQSMSKSDLLILPSKYDGYGAVVNEGLQCGCQILVSNKCGSEFLIRKHPQFGYVFDVNSSNDFINKFKTILNKGTMTIKQKEYIYHWSQLHISPDIIANYLYDYIDYYFDSKKNRPIQPWE